MSTTSKRLRAPIGIVSTYPPTACGIATFSASLATALRSIAPEREVRIVRLVDRLEPDLPASPVVAQLVAGSEPSRDEAVSALSGCAAVILQHEYGIFGGPDGDEVLDLVQRIDAPLIAVLHTLRPEPRPHQREVLEGVIAAAQQIVVMSSAAARILARVHGVDAGRILIIPHGGASIAAPPRVPRQPQQRPTLVTWGLIGPGKGIERALDAVARLRDLDPPPRYRVIGRTHPKVLAHQGEAYREGLVARVEELGIGDLVEFDARYLELPELQALLAETDVVVLPYDNVEQVTSGVLADALAAGLPVVATDFPHAREALASGAGRVVDHDDIDGMAEALREILTDDRVAADMRRAALATTSEASWTAVASRYLELVNGLVGRTAGAAVA